MLNQTVNSSNYSQPAGFWLRVWATLFDLAIISIPKALVNSAMALFVLELIETSLANSGSSQTAMVQAIVPILIYGAISLAGTFLMISLFYYPVMESSRAQGTPGKRFFGLAVTDLYGGRITFSRAILRHLARSISMLPMFIGITGMFGPYLLKQQPGPAGFLLLIVGALASAILNIIHYPMAAFTLRKQALHDKLASTLVVRSKELSFGSTYFRAFVSILLVFAVPILAQMLTERLAGQQSTERVKALAPKIQQAIRDGKLLGEKTASSGSGWREIKPIWRSSQNSTGQDLPSSVVARNNLGLVTVKAHGVHSISFEARGSVTIGIEPLQGEAKVAPRCKKGCLSITAAGNNPLIGLSKKVNVAAKDGKIGVSIENLEAFPIELLIYSER